MKHPSHSAPPRRRALVAAVLVAALAGCSSDAPKRPDKLDDAAVYNTQLGINYMHQNELAVASLKFPNLKIFGCWWFMNNPGFIEEITRMRLELLGTGFIPQHSDCRVVDQLLYKWDHSRAVISRVLAEKYGLLLDAGYKLTEERIKNDVELLLAGNVEKWISGGR